MPLPHLDCLLETGLVETDDPAWTDLALACAKNDAEKVRADIQENKVDLNGSNRDGFTVLLIAVKRSAVDVVRLLVEHGTSVL